MPYFYSVFVFLLKANTYSQKFNKLGQVILGSGGLRTGLENGKILLVICSNMQYLT